MQRSAAAQRYRDTLLASTMGTTRTFPSQVQRAGATNAYPRDCTLSEPELWSSSKIGLQLAHRLAVGCRPILDRRLGVIPHSPIGLDQERDGLLGPRSRQNVAASGDVLTPVGCGTGSAACSRKWTAPFLSTIKDSQPSWSS